MKKFAMLLLLTIVASTVLTSCSKEDDEPDSSSIYSNHELLGYWEVEGQSRRSLRFYADGTGLEDERKFPTEFTWKASTENKMLFITKQGGSTLTLYYEIMEGMLVVYENGLELYGSYAEQEKFTGSTTGAAGNNITYRLDLNSGTITFSGTGDMYNYKNLKDRPWHNSGIKKAVIEKGITSLGESAFYGFRSLIDIELPEGIIVINKFSLFGVNFGHLTIPNSVKTIKENAFNRYAWMDDYDYRLTSYYNQVSFGKDSKLEVIEDEAGVPMVGYLVCLPNSLKKIGSYAINAHDLSYIELGPNITYIGAQAFLTDERNWGDFYIDCITPPTTKYSSGYIIGVLENLNNYPMAFMPVTIDSYWTLHVPEGSKSAYAKVDAWRNFYEIEIES